MPMSSQRARPIHASGSQRKIPHARFWSILFRTLHLVAISILVGGHFFGAPASRLLPFLYAAIVTGGSMAVLEAYPSFQFLHQGWGVLVLIKLALLCVIPLAWNYRVPILITVLVIGSLGSHMPKRFRHYSLIYGPEERR